MSKVREQIETDLGESIRKVIGSRAGWERPNEGFDRDLGRLFRMFLEAQEDGTDGWTTQDLSAMKRMMDDMVLFRDNGGTESHDYFNNLKEPE